MRNETLKNYQNALQDVELRCKMNTKVTNTIIAEEYKVGNSFVSYAKQLGYIMPTSRGYYNWCEESANEELAQRLLKYTNLKIQKSIKRTEKRHIPSVFEVVKKKKPFLFEVPEEKTEQPKQSKVKPAKTETTSWFWGLYTKTVKG